MAIKEILVVDDEIGIRELLSEILFDEGYHVHLAENAAQARSFRMQQVPHLVLLDIWMPETDGITLLKEWVAQGLLTMPVVMMSGHGTIETALEATRIGAVDFLEKPISLQKLLDTVAKAIQQSDLQRVTATPSVRELLSVPESMPHEWPQLFDMSLREARDQFDSQYFKYHMNKENGNMRLVAEKAGLERTHLYRKLKQLGLRVNKKEADEE